MHTPLDDLLLQRSYAESDGASELLRLGTARDSFLAFSSSTHRLRASGPGGSSGEFGTESLSTLLPSLLRAPRLLPGRSEPGVLMNAAYRLSLRWTGSLERGSQFPRDSGVPPADAFG